MHKTRSTYVILSFYSEFAFEPYLACEQRGAHKTKGRA